MILIWPTTVPLASVVAFVPAVCKSVKAVDTDIAVCVPSEISSTEFENPMKDGLWFVKPNKGANGKGIIITDNVSSVDLKDAVYQKNIDNNL